MSTRQSAGLERWQLAAGLTAGQQKKLSLLHLQRTLVRLVQSFSGTLLPDVPIEAAAAGSGAPQLTISIMQQLLLLALDPYFARVLGNLFRRYRNPARTSIRLLRDGYWADVLPSSWRFIPACFGAPLAPRSALSPHEITAGGVRRFGVGCETIARKLFCPGPIRVPPFGVAAATASASAASLGCATKAMLAACSFGQGFSTRRKPQSSKLHCRTEPCASTGGCRDRESVNVLPPASPWRLPHSIDSAREHDSQCTKLRHGSSTPSS